MSIVGCWFQRTLKQLEREQTDRQTDKQTDTQDDYCNPRACAPRVNNNSSGSRAKRKTRTSLKDAMAYFCLSFKSATPMWQSLTEFTASLVELAIAAYTPTLCNSSTNKYLTPTTAFLQDPKPCQSFRQIAEVHTRKYCTAFLLIILLYDFIFC